MSLSDVQAHAHCEICGGVVAVGTRFCSTACEEKHQEQQKEKKRFIFQMAAILVLVIVALQVARFL